jgi:RNA polymerase sigma-70 factor (ECF subfamily)
VAGETILPQTETDLLETVVREYSRLVYRIALSVLRNHAEAEDATQETFLRVLRYGRRLGAVQDPKAWLARIAWRLAVERRRKAPPVKTEEATDALPSAAAAADALLLVEQERNALVERLIAALPEQLRDPLLLSSVEEMSPREVASTLGISEAAVRSRAFRAREILRDKLLALRERKT